MPEKTSVIHPRVDVQKGSVVDRRERERELVSGADLPFRVM